MVEEILLIEVVPGKEKEFEEAFQKVSILLSEAKGCHGCELRACIEKENKYLVAVTWESVDAHLVDFKNSSAFHDMKTILGPFYMNPPLVEHYKKVKY